MGNVDDKVLSPILELRSGGLDPLADVVIARIEAAEDDGCVLRGRAALRDPEVVEEARRVDIDAGSAGGRVVEGSRGSDSTIVDDAELDPFARRGR